MITTFRVDTLEAIDYYSVVKLNKISDMLKMLWKDKADPAWNARYRLFDFDNNGVTDIADLVIAARAMIWN